MKILIRKTIDKIPNLQGFSVMEMLVVIFVFSILGVISTQILALSLRSSQKSESIGEARANVMYAIGVMERLLRNATEIDVEKCNLTPNKLQYINDQGENCFFECQTTEDKGYIVSGCGLDPEVRLTSSKVDIECSQVFSCEETAGVPPSVTILLNGSVGLDKDVDSADVTVQTNVQLRTY